MAFQVTRRWVWWAALTVAALVGVVAKWDAVWTGPMTEVTRGLAVLFVLLLLMPLVSEFEGFGLKVRSQLDALKQELTTTIRAQFQTLSQNLNVNVQLPSAPTAEEVHQVEKSFTQKVGEALAAQPPLDKLLPEDDQDLAVFRQAVEREVWRLWHQRRALPPLGAGALGSLWGHTAEQAAQELIDQGKLPQDLGRAAQMLMWFAGPRPPGDLPDLPRAEQVRFVRNAGWNIVWRLRNEN